MIFRSISDSKKNYYEMSLQTARTYRPRGFTEMEELTTSFQSFMALTLSQKSTSLISMLFFIDV